MFFFSLGPGQRCRCGAATCLNRDPASRLLVRVAASRGVCRTLRMTRLPFASRCRQIKPIHNMRIPLQGSAFYAVSAVYVVVPLTGLWYAMQWANAKSEVPSRTVCVCRASFEPHSRLALQNTALPAMIARKKRQEAAGELPWQPAQGVDTVRVRERRERERESPHWNPAFGRCTPQDDPAVDSFRQVSSAAGLQGLLNQQQKAKAAAAGGATVTR